MFLVRRFLKNHTTNFAETWQGIYSKDILKIVLEKIHENPFSNKKAASVTNGNNKINVLIRTVTLTDLRRKSFVCWTN